MKNSRTNSRLLGTLFLGASTLCVALPLSAKPKERGPVSQPVTLVGIVMGTPQGREFNFRANHQVWRVNIHSGASIDNVRAGDRIRVFGKPLGSKLYYSNIRVLEHNASNSPDDYTTNRSAG